MKVASGMLALLCALGRVEAQEGEFQKQALQKFHDTFDSATAKDDDKAAAIVQLAQLKTPATAKALVPVLTKSAVPFRMVAARELAQFKGVSGASDALLSALRSQSNLNDKARSVRILALRGLGDLQARDAAGDVEKLLEDRNEWIAKAAIDAAGKIRARSSVAALLVAFRRIEGPEGKNEISVNPLEAELPPTSLQGILKEERGRTKPVSSRDLLREPVLGALKSITCQEFATLRDWETWWRKSKSGFTVPE